MSLVRTNTKASRDLFVVGFPWDRASSYCGGAADGPDRVDLVDRAYSSVRY